MKTIPTLREKKRYLAFRIISEETINRGVLTDELLNSISSLFGDTGASEINPALMSYDGGYGILRCQKDRTSDTRAALACINKVGGGRVSIMVLGISGTVKGAMEKFIQQRLVKEPEPDKE
ncbi:MAG: ribonuclease P [Euryarchaeota archaeon]|nr:ribonuclease P [Euryarchaeota archaeon]MBU4221841.1 ribonuclease P [Euryarchaeota archaeon]MBU4339697.1 ribonuclease P [Euryarchaeota archaeon]MBU4454681.1 ribonuclease P [Euryarchaeota archaeon]MCG2737771.1 ribonuclease P [Candidatus Methanoperedenaceae archaeon]